MWLDKHFEESIMLFLLSVMVILMGLQVFMRYVIARSLSWPEEIIRFGFIWFAFLSFRRVYHFRLCCLEGRGVAVDSRTVE